MNTPPKIEIEVDREPDAAGAPNIMLRALEGRAFWEATSSLALWPLWHLAPRGDGQPVLVLPGLAAGDESTLLMRRFLSQLGYAVSPWGQGINLGLRDNLMQRLQQQLHSLQQRHGRKVSLIGWSLGGLYARELAKEAPDQVRQVISLGSPFAGHPRDTHAFRLYEWVSGHRIGAPDVHEPLRMAPPVPTTSIWSRSDGVVAYQCSIERTPGQTENIEVDASHLGIGAHPLALFAIADRLAQPEGAWRPFTRSGLRRLLYRDPERL